ncbi:MAG: hypothetical protein ACM3JG_00530 [Thiohalocapsa sp.]
MAHQFVVGLFTSKGIAEDACNRLKFEGVPAPNISLLLLHEVASPVPATVRDELAGLSIDPLIVGDVRDNYAPYIRNGETAVFVNTHSEAEEELAAGILKLYAPLRIRVVEASEGAPLGRDIL